MVWGFSIICALEYKIISVAPPSQNLQYTLKRWARLVSFGSQKNIEKNVDSVAIWAFEAILYNKNQNKSGQAKTVKIRLY